MLTVGESQLLKARVNTLVGSLLVGVWAFGCALLIWNASFDTNPVTEGFAAIVARESQSN